MPIQYFESHNSEYKIKLYDIIMSGKGLQYVMDACSELIGNPFLFANQSLQLISKSTNCDAFPQVFDWIGKAEDKSLQYTQEAETAGYFKKIYASDAPVYGVVSGLTVHWAAARVRYQDKILGSILTADCQTPFSNQYGELLPLVCQAIAFTRLQSFDREYGIQRHAPLLIELIEGKSREEMDENAVRTFFKILQSPLPKTMRLLILRPTDSRYIVNLRYLDTQLHTLFPSSVGIVYKNECVRLIDGMITKEYVIDQFKQYVHTKHIVCGVSRKIHSPLIVHDAYLQADASIRLEPLPKRKIVNGFDDVLGAYLMEQVQKSQGISDKNLIMPEILLLKSMDDREGTEKVKDLAVYLSCGRNVTRASELRCVHKNSMYYRLHRISEVMGLDLDSDDTCVQLIFSLCLLGDLPLSKE